MRSDIRRMLVTALAAAAFSASAVAGLKSASDVVISDTYSWAYGDVGHVYHSDDREQIIGCELYGTSGYCWAKDASGLSRGCSSTDARWLRTMAAVKSDSYVRFDWDGNGRCTFVAVQNDSMTDKR